jgi:hypothetical protein
MNAILKPTFDPFKLLHTVSKYCIPWCIGISFYLLIRKYENLGNIIIATICNSN